MQTVIQALVRLPGVRLLIAGGPEKPSLDTDPEAIRIRQMAASLGVADRVHLLGSVRMNSSRVDPRRRLVVCTPWYEPFGIVPIEAAACGKPVVGSAVGGLLDTIVDGGTGSLVPPRDPVATARAIRDLLADTGRRRAYGVAARQRAVRMYDWDAVSAATDLAYRSVVGVEQRSEVSA